MSGANWGGRTLGPWTRQTGESPGGTVLYPPTVNLPDSLRTRATAYTYDLLISPAERPPITELGTVSSIPETMGADIAWLNEDKWVGVQRKAVPDLITSTHDGRLAMEVAQLQQCDVAILIVEGRASFTSDGNYLGGYGGAKGWTRKRHEMLLMSLQSSGVMVSFTDGTLDTCERVLDLVDHYRNGSDSGIGQRPNKPPASKWGSVDSLAWVAWTLMSCPGVGADTARAIAERLGHIWRPTVTVKQLMEVPGVGRKRAEAILRAFGGDLDEPVSEADDHAG